MRTDAWLGVVTIFMMILSGYASVHFIPKEKRRWKIFYFVLFTCLGVAGIWLVVRVSNESAVAQRDLTARLKQAQDELKRYIAEQGEKTSSQIHSEFSRPLTALPPTPEQQLCPNALPYRIRKVPVPPVYSKVVNLSYAADIIIRKTRDSIFHVRIYSRAWIAGAYLTEPGPSNSIQSGITDGERVLDIISTRPLSLIKVTLISAEEIRIKCVNQEN